MSSKRSTLKTKSMNATLLDPDPVFEQTFRDSTQKSHKKIKKEPKSADSTLITPDMGTRLDLSIVPEPVLELPIKYTPPKTKKQKKAIEERHRLYIEELNFCEKNIKKVPSHQTLTKVEIKFTAPSAEIKEAKVMPQKASITPSALYPEPPRRSDLVLHRPKSGTFINSTLPPPKKRKRRLRRKPKPPVDETETFYEMLKEELAAIAEMMGEGEGGEFTPTPSDHLTRQFRKRVSQISKTTSYKSADTRPIYGEGEGEGETEEVEIQTLEDRFVQKFYRDSEEERYKREKPPKIKKGTFENFSFTKLVQPTLKSFYYGVKLGTIHQGDLHFSGRSRNRQGICMSIAAYCFTVFKHPTCWREVDIDAILEAGDNLYLESSTSHHLHHDQKLTIPSLMKYCKIDNSKVRFVVGDPEVVGMTRSEDKKVYNLTKGLNVFFNRNKKCAAVLETDNFFYVIWRDKHFFFFDANPRTIDLYSNANEGFALLAHFYDLKAVLTVLLDRTGLKNAPFVVYSLKAFKILEKDAEEKDSQLVISEMDSYKILDEERAVVVGSFDLADKCFGFSRNKQSLTMAVVALVYSKITPSSCWYKMTIDKIMIIGNQLFLECIRNDYIDQVTVTDLPAVFTIGPYVVEIYIYANQKVDLMYKKQKCVLLKKLEEFFEQNTNAIIEIDQSTLAVWKQRSMYHCFDPYSRNNEALKCRDGAGCTSMHTNIVSLVNTIQSNFNKKESIFKVHALKVCKIHRDPDHFKLFPKGLTMNDYPIEDFKKFKMRKGHKMATCKPVTVDKTLNATILGKIPEEGSLLEVASNVKSLAMEEIPPMVQKFPSKSWLKALSPALDELSEKVVDLDSPSLSDTQIEPIPLEEAEDDEEGKGFIDLDDFYMTLEESELLARGEEGDLGEAVGEPREDAEGEEEILDGGEGEDDWYYTQANFTQVGSGSLLSRMSRGANTDIDSFEITYELLPSLMPQQFMRPCACHKSLMDNYLTNEPQVTLSQELSKPSNFVTVPDGSQIVLGTQNIANYGEENDLEFMAPFICVMAAAVAKKYSISTWSKDVVDYILKCGTDLYKSTNTRYDQVYTLEIPRVSLGSTDFFIKVDYVYDTNLKQKVLEIAIRKVLATKQNCCAIMATPTYSAAIFLKNHLYYLYDSFGNNEVGLGKGPSNEGVACISRYVNVEGVAARILHNKQKREESEHIEYNRFVMSCCIVKNIPREETIAEAEAEEEGNIGMEQEDGAGGDDDFPVQTHKKPKVPPEEEKPKIGYQKIDKLWKIEGSGVVGSGGGGQDELYEDFFVCVCATLLLLNTPLKKWNCKKVDNVIERGREIYQNVDDFSTCSKKFIENVLIDDYVFNLITKPIQFSTYKQQKTLSTSFKTMLVKHHENFIIQIGGRCYALSIDREKNLWHLFDPNSSKRNEKASWTRYAQQFALLQRLRKDQQNKDAVFHFYVIDITSIARAPKDVIIKNRLHKYRVVKSPKIEMLGTPFHEELEWLNVDPIPWSYKVEKNQLEKWHYWFCELPPPTALFSLFSGLTPCDERFLQRENLGHLVVAIGMTMIYELCDWSMDVMDSILLNGDQYFRESVEPISEENYEMTMEDMNKKCTIFPYEVQVKFTPVVEGTMFLMRLKQFNLYKALRFFFDDYERRYGIICVSIAEGDKRQYAFGKMHDSEYFLYDCCSVGPPMFAEGMIPAAYILRTTTLNRLVHVMTLTLRGGDFFVYEVSLSELKPLSMS